jgi:hypothetical protein
MCSQSTGLTSIAKILEISAPDSARILIRSIPTLHGSFNASLPLASPKPSPSAHDCSENTKTKYFSTTLHSTRLGLGLMHYLTGSTRPRHCVCSQSRFTIPTSSIAISRCCCPQAHATCSTMLNKAPSQYTFSQIYLNAIVIVAVASIRFVDVAMEKPRAVPIRLVLLGLDVACSCGTQYWKSGKVGHMRGGMSFSGFL